MRNLASLCTTFQASEAWEVWELGMTEGRGTHTAKGTAAGVKLRPLSQSSHLRLTQLTCPVELPGPMLFVQDGPKSRRREEGELLFVPCLLA